MGLGAVAQLHAHLGLYDGSAHGKESLPPDLRSTGFQGRLVLPRQSAWIGTDPRRLALRDRGRPRGRRPVRDDARRHDVLRADRRDLAAQEARRHAGRRRVAVVRSRGRRRRHRTDADLLQQIRSDVRHLRPRHGSVPATDARGGRSAFRLLDADQQDRRRSAGRRHLCLRGRAQSRRWSDRHQPVRADLRPEQRDRDGCGRKLAVQGDEGGALSAGCFSVAARARHRRGTDECRRRPGPRVLRRRVDGEAVRRRCVEHLSSGAGPGASGVPERFHGDHRSRLRPGWQPVCARTRKRRRPVGAG